MTAHFGAMHRDRLDKPHARAKVLAFPGIWLIADQLKKQSDEWLEGDPDAGLVSQTAMTLAARAGRRMVGVRDILCIDHPVVVALHEKLVIERTHIPAPDKAIVATLSKLNGFKFDGLVATIDGVPLPAGKAQTDWFIVQRYRPLYSSRALPHLIYRRDPENMVEADRAALGVADGVGSALIHLLAYDAANVTDEMQEALLSYSAAIHRDNLVALQRNHTALYVAIWRRDMRSAMKQVQNARRRGLLRPPHPKSVRKFAIHLLNGASLMNEFERLFEIVDTLKFAGGATRISIQTALKSSKSMAAMHTREDATGTFIYGSVAHVRSLHSTMNTKQVKHKTADPILEGARKAFFNASGFWEKTGRFEWIEGKMPGQWFLGVEPALLAQVALIQMISNMQRWENGFWLRDKRGGARDLSDERRAMVFELAVVITSNICPATARSMLPRDKLAEGLAANGLRRSDADWRDAVVPTLIRNPSLADQVEVLAHVAGMAWPIPGNADCDRPRRSSPYDRAMERARALKAVHQPGWTQGFLFEAWLRPKAEVAFLRNCCRYVRYDPAEANKRDARNATLAQVTRADGRPIVVTDIATGLPRQHPLERIQDLFRDMFDRLQVEGRCSDGSPSAPKKRAWRDAALTQAAALLPAVSPITLDPQHAERWWCDLDDKMVAIASEGAWNT